MCIVSGFVMMGRGVDVVALNYWVRKLNARTTEVLGELPEKPP